MLFENWVCSELIKRHSPLATDNYLGFWRSKSGAEVDFVVERGERLVAVEVKTARLKREKLTRSSRSFIDAYSPDIFYVINRALNTEKKVGNTLVRWVGPEIFAQVWHL